MKPIISILTVTAFAMFASPRLSGEEEPTPEIDGLRKSAGNFVIAYNQKDAAALAALFTENGEIIDLTGEEITSGRENIKARYEEIFASKDVPQAAVEVSSVRLVAPNLAIEDGTLHLDPAGDDMPVISTTYTAALVKNSDGVWQIASTRSLKDVTDAGGKLADFAASLKGNWTSMRDGVRFDFAFGWDGSGKFLIGELLSTSPDAAAQTTKVRIGWDGARKTITWWTFDSGGGFSKGDWTPTEEGWLLRSEGTTSSGESTTSTASLVFDGKDVMIWKAKDRVIDGKKLPDTELRIVRQAPEPAAE